MNNKKNIIIATGGTGGHVFPALSIAQYFNDNNYKVLLTTDDRGAKLLQNCNLKYTKINSGKSLKSIKSILKICSGVLKSIITIIRFKPSVVIGFGGYPTLPVMMACSLLRIPIFLHEGNAFVGKINRFFSKKCINIFTSFQEIYGINIKDSNKICFTGNIVRQEIKKYYNMDYSYSKDGKINILITGGSGGASFFSNEFIKVFKYISNDLKNKISVVHQVKSESEIKEVKYFYSKENIKSEVATFFNDMPDRMFKSDLIICRSGVGTISEISTIGRPCIMVPSPNVADNHQLYNAKFYSKNNACILLEENNFKAEDFSKVIENLLRDKDKMQELASKIKGMAVIDSDNKIFNIINDYILNKDI